MAQKIYRGYVGYMGVDNEEHNGDFLKIAEETVAELGGELKLSWVAGERDDPYWGLSLRAEGEPEDLLLFTDDEAGVDLTGASEEWILLVNAILRRFDEHSSELWGEGSALELLNE